MKKLHSLAVYALVTPILTLGAGSALAERSTADDDMNTERQDVWHSESEKAANNQQMRDKSDMKQHMRDKSDMKHTGYMDKAPVDGLQASNLIGTGVRTTNGDDDVGSVSDLVIDENGQVVAIVVGVGGFLGMGDRDVAIGWDEVTRSRGDDGLELRIDVTRDDLSSAPAFEWQGED